jgi:Tfp pilus assembly protein FimT
MEGGNMSCSGTERGFSLIGLLMACVIVVILMTMALQTYGPVLQSVNTGTGPTNSLGMNLTRTRLRGIHQAEMMYNSIHRSYATWDQLVRDGQIASGYSNRSMGRGTPYIPCYDVNIEVSRTGFVVTATPNVIAGAPEGSPVLKIDQTGQIEEVQAE